MVGTIAGLAAAIRSMTSLPATVYGLKERGQIRPGAFADVLLFDPAKVDDVATYQEPHQLAAGMDTIIVNGRLVRRDGVFAAELSGRVVTPDRH